MTNKPFENIKNFIKNNWKWFLLFMVPWPVLIMVAVYKSYIVYKNRGKKQYEKSNENQT